MKPVHLKIAVTGAAGNIGYALLFRIASGEMLGDHTTIDLHLLERTEMLPALEGIRMELEDCAFPLLKNILCTDQLDIAMRDIHWALLIGASPRTAGMERADLLKINGAIFKAQGQAIDQYAARDVRVLVIGNPCNTNSLIAMHHAPSISRRQFYAMTMLDEKRAQFQLAKKANVAIQDISQLYIWGNHSATQYPDFYHAKIRSQPLTQIITDENWLKNNFIHSIQQRGAEIIQARKASSAASAANAIIATVQCLSGYKKNDGFSVALCSQGEYDIDEGLIFSFPCEYHDQQIHIISDIQHPAFSQEKIKRSLEELRAEYRMIQALSLI
jgi:malate dehydrogenase